MEGTPAIYLGRIIDKKHFRAFIYNPNGQQRLVESWEEFEANMQSGVWFATAEEAEASKGVEGKVTPKAKPKSRAKAKAKPVPDQEPEDADDVLPDDGSVFEVTDDFLPKENE